MDHDAHHHRKQLVDADGKELYSTKFSRAQGKEVLVKRKEEKTYPYVRGALDDMVVRRRSVTLSASSASLPRKRRQYANPGYAPTAEAKATLVAERAAHSRF